MKFQKLIFLLFSFLIFLWTANADLMYPIQKMSKVECRFQKYSTLWDDCKMDLPILNTSDYTKYKNDYSLYRRVYTVLWWWSYTYGWDVWNWWHSWVDIASAEGTPTYAITDWKVLVASFLAWRWNTVKIEHTINWRKIYAVYAHMSKIDVKVWDSVNALTKVWEVWTTWNSTWNHLHFQIDITQASWPWYRKNCKVKDYNSIINWSACFEELNQNTLDPLLFLETNWAIVKPGNSWSIVVDKPKQEIISQEWLLSRAEILKREIDEFLKSNNLKLSITNFGWNIELWKSWTLKVQVSVKWSNRPFTWSFPGDMNFKYDSWKMTVFPTWVLQIDWGYRDIKITPKIAWRMSIDVYIWETFVKKINFWVIDTKKSVLPKSATFAVSSSNVISENKKWILYFKDNFWTNILWFKFDWKYTLTWKDNNIKFCLKKANSLSVLSKTFNSNCKEEDFKNQVSFDYSSTTSWILIFEYKMLDVWSTAINILDSSKKVVWTKLVKWVLPNSLNKNYSYYEEIVYISKIWIPTWINKWYFLQDRDLNWEDSINFIKNTLWVLESKCSNETCRKNILEYKSKVNSLKIDKFSYPSRYEFMEMLSKYLPSQNYNWDSTIYRDLNESQNKIAKNILKSSIWKDSFAQTRYFQPDKKITRWEASFLIYNLVK